MKASAADLATQFAVAERVLDMLAVTYDGFNALEPLQRAIAERAKTGAAKPAAEAFEKKVDAIRNGTTAAPGVGIVNRDAARLYQMLVSGDARPSGPLEAAIAESCQALTTALDGWRRVMADELPEMNATLAKSSLPALSAVPAPPTPRCAP